jgi:predicted flap endonuclease-1-like 5' DNA nuclease
MEWIAANWIVLGAGAGAMLVLLALWLLLSRRKPKPISRDYHDVLSEGAAPAARNSALIDAPPAAAVAPIAAPPASAIEELGEPSPAEAGDDLTRIKSIGPKLSAALRALGVTRYAQIAAWSEADLAAIDVQLGAFAGRAARDNWTEQCILLSSGDIAAYEEKFGKL